MPYCVASSVIVNSSLSYSRIKAKRSSMGDVSRHGMGKPPVKEAAPACGNSVTHVAGLKCYLCPWTEPAACLGAQCWVLGAGCWVLVSHKHQAPSTKAP